MQIKNGDISKTTSSALREAAANQILILDGAMGTMVQSALPDHKGIADILNIEKPEVIRDIHRRYLEAGADIISTNTFSSQRISMAECGYADRIRELNLAGVSIARKLADEYTALNSRKPRFVAASIGPTALMASKEGDAARQTLREDYQEQAEAVIEGGADALLIETIFDVVSAETACEAAEAAMEKLEKRVELMLSMTINNDGRTFAGHTMEQLVDLADRYNALSVGLNCSFGAKNIVPFVEELASKTSRMISVHPNAGLPDSTGCYKETPESFASALKPLIESRTVNIIGGCCGTDERHIRQLHSLVSKLFA